MRRTQNKGLKKLNTKDMVRKTEYRPDSVIFNEFSTLYCQYVHISNVSRRDFKATRGLASR